MILHRNKFLAMSKNRIAGTCRLCDYTDFLNNERTDLLEHFPECILNQTDVELFHITPVQYSEMNGQCAEPTRNYRCSSATRLRVFCKDKDVYADLAPKGTPKPWYAWRWRELQAKVYPDNHWRYKLWH